MEDSIRRIGTNIGLASLYKRMERVAANKGSGFIIPVPACMGCGKPATGVLHVEHPKLPGWEHIDLPICGLDQCADLARRTDTRLAYREEVRTWEKQQGGSYSSLSVLDSL